MARKVQNKKGAHYCRSLVQSQKSADHLLMKAKSYSSSSELHGADKIGYLSFGVVDSSHGTSNDILHVIARLREDQSSPRNIAWLAVE